MSSVGRELLTYRTRRLHISPEKARLGQKQHLSRARERVLVLIPHLTGISDRFGEISTTFNHLSVISRLV